MAPSHLNYRTLTALLIALVLALALPAGASAESRARLALNAIGSPPALAGVSDSIIGPLPHAYQARASASGNRYSTGDGNSVAIDVSPTYLNPSQTAQDFADYLGTVLHGSEVNRLSVYIASQAEIASLCGPGTLACYSPSDEEMVAEPPGSSTGPGEPSAEYVITHEYGHHIAQNRINRPWNALAWGPKRWASYERVCPRVRSGRYFPGDEGANYYENPGEAWAESTAWRAYPNETSWDWDPALKPDATANARIVRDIRRPWRHNRRRRWQASFTGGESVKRHSFPTPLDGSANVTMTMAVGDNFHVRLLAGSGKLLAAGQGAHTEHAGFTVCGSRILVARVQRISGHGAFTVKVSRP